MNFDPATAKARDVEAYLREVIRKAFGDRIENESTITSTRGFYTVEINWMKNNFASFKNFRKSEAKKVAKAIRGLKG